MTRFCFENKLRHHRLTNTPLSVSAIYTFLLLLLLLLFSTIIDMSFHYSHVLYD
jgi:hypothetical protein